MFDFGATEFLVIAMVALIVIGPRELPGLLRQFGQMVGKVRRMAGDFQEQFSQAIDESEEVKGLKKDLNEITDQTKLDVDFDPISDTEREIREAVGETRDPDWDDGFDDVPDDPGLKSDKRPASGETKPDASAKPAAKDNAVIREPSAPREAAPAKRLPVTTGTTNTAGSVAAGKRNSDGKPTAVES